MDQHLKVRECVGKQFNAICYGIPISGVLLGGNTFQFIDFMYQGKWTRRPIGAVFIKSLPLIDDIHNFKLLVED